MAATSTRAGVTYNLGPLSGIPMGEGREFQVGDLTVAVFQTRAGDLFATRATCPHRDGPLADGIIGDNHVICPLHAFKFNLATGRPAGNDCAPLTTYPVSISGRGDVLLQLSGQVD